ncbi:MAG: glycosyltransferase family 4 protein [Methylophilaceae bacterium]|jgi:glycosyltransferase involved in cell wall biosynthesis
MKLLFAIKGLHQAAGGAERVICDVCSYLTDHSGHEISLLTFDAPGATPFYPLSPRVRLLQLGLGDPAAPTSLSQLLKRAIALRQVVKAEKPDVAIGFMHSMFVPLAFALVGTDIPVVASEHIVMSHYRNRRAEFALFMAAVPFIARITVLSDSVARDYPQWIHRKMVPVTNPVSPLFQHERTHDSDKSQSRILSIGRLAEQKDHVTLLRAFALLAQEFPAWTLKILGEGPLRPLLESEVSRLQLTDRVTLPGVVADVGKEITEASFFALASRYESFGLVFAEAMACGKASVAFADCPGANEVIEDGRTGLLVSGVQREEAFANGLRRLMANQGERERMGNLAKRRVFERFAIELVCAKWEEVLCSVRHHQ